MTKQNLPNSFLTAMEDLLSEEFQDYLDSFQQNSFNGLRVNTLKVDPGHFALSWKGNLRPVPWVENGFYYEDSIRPSRHPYYFAGLYYLQEPSAMTPAAMLPVEPGDRVLDLCAAPGGKSTELGAKLKGDGFLVANDISNSRAKALLKNLEMFGISNVCVTSEEPKKLAEAFPEYFDKILVDAPCSGEGMFRRDPDMVKSWAEHGPEYYCVIQREILRQAVTMLKPGGLLLYSTCTFSPLEDEEMILELLETQMELVELPLFEGAVSGRDLPGSLRLFPHKIEGEGHFVALLRKPGQAESAVPGNIPGASLGATLGISLGASDRREVESFLSACKTHFQWDRIRLFQDMVCYLPEGVSPRIKLRYLRTGLLLGTLKKGRFEPSQALAMTLCVHTFANSISFSAEDERVIRYLKGETVMLSKEEAVTGWCLVCVDGYGLGFAKGMGMTLKNKYYPGWRWQ